MDSTNYVDGSLAASFDVLICLVGPRGFDPPDLLHAK